MVKWCEMIFCECSRGSFAGSFHKISNNLLMGGGGVSLLKFKNPNSLWNVPGFCTVSSILGGLYEKIKRSFAMMCTIIMLPAFSFLSSTEPLGRALFRLTRGCLLWCLCTCGATIHNNTFSEYVWRSRWIFICLIDLLMASLFQYLEAPLRKHVFFQMVPLIKQHQHMAPAPQWAAWNCHKLP